LGRELEIEETTQRGQMFRLIVDELRVFLENLVVVGSAGVLKLVDRLRVEQVIFALAAILVVPADVESVPVVAAARKCLQVPVLDLGGDDLQADAADAR